MNATAEPTAANAPRVVHQPGAFFFVTEGEVWRVHDTDYTGTVRTAPSADSDVRARLFVAAASPLTLIHHFPARDSRSLDPSALLAQLDRTC